MSTPIEPSEQEKQMAARLQAIFTNKPLQAKIVDIVVGDKPIGWGPRSSSPYYNEKCALEIKKVFDAIRETGKPFCYRYDWFEQNFGLGKDTLYTRVYQSWRYLLERMDPTHEYQRFKEEKLDIWRKRGVGVMIELKKHLTTDGPAFEPEEVMPESEGPKWRRRMQDWLEDADSSTSFKQEGLVLTADEIAELKLHLSSLANVMPSITSHSVKLVKINLEA